MSSRLRDLTRYRDATVYRGPAMTDDTHVTLALILLHELPNDS